MHEHQCTKLTILLVYKVDNCYSIAQMDNCVQNEQLL